MEHLHGAGEAGSRELTERDEAGETGMGKRIKYIFALGSVLRTAGSNLNFKWAWMGNSITIMLCFRKSTLEGVLRLD